MNITFSELFFFDRGRIPCWESCIKMSNVRKHIKKTMHIYHTTAIIIYKMNK